MRRPCAHAEHGEEGEGSREWDGMGWGKADEWKGKGELEESFINRGCQKAARRTIPETEGD